MKNVFTVIFAICSSSLLFAQTKAVKLYAFKQNVLPGVAPSTTIDEKGKTTQMPLRMSANYYIYMEVPVEKKILVNHLWIHGKMYDVNIEKPKLPVVVRNNEMPTNNADTLVKAGDGNVIQLVPKAAKETIRLSSSLRKKIKLNEIVVQASENGKENYYYSSVKLLKPLMLQ